MGRTLFFFSPSLSLFFFFLVQLSVVGCAAQLHLHLRLQRRPKAGLLLAALTAEWLEQDAFGHF